MAGVKRKRWRVALATLIATAFVVTLAANLTLGDKQIDREVPTLYPAEHEQFARTMSAMLGPQILDGNEVQTLLNGDEIFPPMLQAIRAAKKSVNLETYIYWSGEIARRFEQALVERARAGVRVNVLFDAVGSGKIDEDAVKRMKAAGIRVEKYNPLRWNTLAKMNNRTHRKLLVVDGTIGFTGGAAIADEWTGDGTDPKRWRDTHFRLRGPAVAQMQAAFSENWIEATGEVLHGADYFPPLERAGEHKAQLFVSSPGGGGESMQLMYLLSIAAAAKSLDIANAYFVPDNVERKMLVAAARRGVRLRVMVPGPTEEKLVKRASRASWGELLRAGIEIYEYQAAFFHCKVMVVDGLWTSVGSTNFDSRSFSVNDEANLNVLDAGFARRQVEDFERDLTRSRRVTLEEWQNRPLGEKLAEHASRLLSSQL
ncbi:MAG: cardiolipin synthase [Betaproteobacteria bacterium]